MTCPPGCLVTVLVPCRNPHPLFLRLALESLLEQTASDWKALAVVDHDDASSAAQVSTLLAEISDPRIRLLEHASSGLAKALNAAMRAAETPYVSILLGDDRLAPSAVEVLLDRIRRFARIDFFHSSRQFIDENGVPLSAVYHAPASFELADFKQTGPVKHLLCWKVASALAIGGMDESLGAHGADDYDFPWSMAEAGYRFQAVDECLYYYRDHRESYRLTTHIPLDRQVAELRKILVKHGVPKEEMEERIRRSISGYLRQALYRDAADRARKDREGYDIHTGWRLPLRRIVLTDAV